MSALGLWRLIVEGRKYLVILAVLAVAAALYLRLNAVEAERDRVTARAAEICATAGASFRPDGGMARDHGKACKAEVARLRAFEAGTVKGSLDLALAAMDERAGKEATDAALAARMAARTNDTLNRMEAANAAIEGDRVGPGWAAAVNELGGLR